VCGVAVLTGDGAGAWRAADRRGAASASRTEPASASLRAGSQPNPSSALHTAPAATVAPTTQSAAMIAELTPRACLPDTSLCIGARPLRLERILARKRDQYLKRPVQRSGLLVRRRAGRSVLYRVSAVGEALLAAAGVARPAAGRYPSAVDQ
jgi:hypothetical protein